MNRKTCYVLTIKEQLLFSNNVLSSLNENLIEIEIVKGITPENIDVRDYYRRGILNHALRPLTPGEYCCSLGHLSIYRKFLSMKSENCLVFEDDVLFHSELDEFVSCLLSHRLSFNGPYIILLGLHPSNCASRMLGKPVIVENSGLSVFSLDKRVARYFYGTFAYVINRSAASSIIKNSESYVGIADHWHKFVSNETKFYFIDLFRHPKDPGQSTINRDRQFVKQDSTNFKNLISSLGWLIYIFILRIQGHKRIKHNDEVNC